MSQITIVSFISYLLVVAAIGLVATSRTKNVTDYAIGSRNLSAPVAGLSAGASDMSGWLLLGLPGAVYVGGLQEAWILVGLVVGAWINWKLVAPRLRRQTADLHDALTLPQFFCQTNTVLRSSPTYRHRRYNDCFFYSLCVCWICSWS